MGVFYLGMCKNAHCAYRSKIQSSYCINYGVATDPTSGSGSLLINIGNSVGKYMEDDNNIKYYAQELKENTYNLAHMNLVMWGIRPDNIERRNGDTLEEDWSYFDENDAIHTYKLLYVDGVALNLLYLKAWDFSDKKMILVILVLDYWPIYLLEQAYQQLLWYWNKKELIMIFWLLMRLKDS